MARILAVDDSTSMREMVAATLRDAGHEVVQAEDGVSALACARDTVFELVIADVNMPNMDGISLVRALRGLPQYRFTPILMLTTETAAELKQAGRAAGATGWMQKPFDPQRLLDTIGRVMG